MITGQATDAAKTTRRAGLWPSLDFFPWEQTGLTVQAVRGRGQPWSEPVVRIRVETTQEAGRKLIVVERHDRSITSDGSVERIHQEDFCRATATPPDRKYEEDGGPALRRIAGIVEAAASRGSLESVLQAVTVNRLIGNGDAHAKNFSLLHERSGALRRAPLYDLRCTLCYGDDRLAMYVDDVHRSDRVTSDRIVNEASRWGLSRSRAAQIVGDILDRAPAAIAAARNETVDLPHSIASCVLNQLRRLLSTSAQ